MTKLNFFATLAAVCMFVALGWVTSQPSAYIGALIAGVGLVFTALAVIAYEDSLSSDF